MLETKGLYKIYRLKKGVPVTALNNISLKFPDRGMIFLLGKSGSGKSTLLNVLGGLDRYDRGEILIKGVSSKAFKQQHFDSYRNTYMGFIFQEYNILEDFTVGANIGIALELQGKKATGEAINQILNQVDLAGYGSRKPGELSGGQKQRVAIARALVKNPEIIMADEPTGALDSTTGRQVLETLKKLSKDKLVIVVSHDQEFAERYADRIITLSDGQVVGDIERQAEAVQENPEETGLVFGAQSIGIPAGYQLTEEDRLAINRYLAAVQSGTVSLQSAAKQTNSAFAPTDPQAIRMQTGGFRLIKSRLPLHNAFKIGASGLKYKKVRLVVTILLSCVAFGLFGLSDTFGAYNHVATCTKSIMDTGISYTSIVKARKRGVGMATYWDRSNYRLNDQDLKTFQEQTQVDLAGVYQPNNANLSFSDQINPERKLTDGNFTLYATNFTGYAEISEADLKEMDATLVAGRLPKGKTDEVAISSFVAESFIKGQYTDGSFAAGSGVDSVIQYQTISKAADLVGKTLELNGKTCTITGIVDTKLDLNRYKTLAEEKDYQTNAEKLVKLALASEFQYASQFSLAQVLMVGEGTIDQMTAGQATVRRISSGNIYLYNDQANLSPQYLGQLADLNGQKIQWLGDAKTTLGKKEIIVSSDLLSGGAYYKGSPAGEGFAGDGSMEMDPLELAKNVGALKGNIYRNNGTDMEEAEGYTIVGVLTSDGAENSISQTLIANDELVQELTVGGDGRYAFAVGGMPEGKEAVRDLVSYCYSETGDVRYELQNSVTYELDTVNEVLKILARVFFYIGLGFALFAAIMLANFISTSISYKKQEIGILRAIGSRSNDVFRIFFSESFLIAMINFILSCIGVLAATQVINHMLRTRAGILITVLNFGPRQILLLLGVSLLVAAVASFLPVKRIASKRPIDAIRNR